MAPAIPRYKNIQNYILNGIASGEFPNGSQIPTELELSEQFKVSRMTVNKAITELSLQKVLTRIAGKGTFVAQQKAQSSSMHVVDIAVEIKNRGNIHSTKLLEKGMIPANESVALALGIYVGTSVAFCHLIHYENVVCIIGYNFCCTDIHSTANYSSCQGYNFDKIDDSCCTKLCDKSKTNFLIYCC